MHALNVRKHQQAVIPGPNDERRGLGRERPYLASLASLTKLPIYQADQIPSGSHSFMEKNGNQNRQFKIADFLCISY